MAQRLALWCAPSPSPVPLVRSFGVREDCVVTEHALAPADRAYRQAASASPEKGILTPDDLWDEAVDLLTGPAPSGAEIWVHQHSAQHLLLDRDREWLLDLGHVFYLRDPMNLIAEAVARGSHGLIEETGLPHQLELYRWLRARAIKPPVVVCEEPLLQRPYELLPQICSSLGVAMDPAMLAVFEGEEAAAPPARVPEDVLRSCMAMFTELRGHALCGGLAPAH